MMKLLHTAIAMKMTYHFNRKIQWDRQGNAYHGNGKMAFQVSTGNAYHDNGKIAYQASSGNTYHANGRSAYQVQSGRSFHDNGQPAADPYSGNAFHHNGRMAYEAAANTYFNPDGVQVPQFPLKLRIGVGIELQVLPEYRVTVYGRKINR
jgi:hypothetical protein